MSSYPPGTLCLIQTVSGISYGEVKLRPSIVIADLGARAMVCPLSSSRVKWPVVIQTHYGVKKKSYANPLWFETINYSYLGLVIGKVPDAIVRGIKNEILEAIGGEA